MKNYPDIKFILVLCFTCLFMSCSDGNGIRTLLDGAFTTFTQKDYDTTQEQLLKAEALVNDETPISDKEFLERMKGINYIELRVMDKAKVSLQKALDYSKQMNDTSRIIPVSYTHLTLPTILLV